MKTVNEQQKKELDTLNKKLKNSESNEENLKIQIAAKERSNTMLLDTLSKLNIELNSEKGYHAGEVRILKQQNATLKKELENNVPERLIDITADFVFGIGTHGIVASDPTCRIRTLGFGTSDLACRISILVTAVSYFSKKIIL